MPEIVIIADDLSGAADCGIVCASAGLDTMVVLGQLDAEPEVTVLAIDGDTRSRSPLEAIAETERLVRAHAGPGRTLFRKIDSTLRGHVAEELAATLAVRREAGPAVIVLAPAFPATGRTTRDGHQHLHGVPLEDTELWRREAIAGRAHMPSMLERVGLDAVSIGLHAVRGPGLRDLVLHGAGHHDVLVFDAESENDLQAVATAASMLGEKVIWAGSAGLARYLPHVTAGRPGLPTAPLPVAGPVLFVVGSASSVSRAQVQRLAAESGIIQVTVPTSVLHVGPDSAGWLVQQRALDAALAGGGDVIVLLGEEEPVDLGRGLLLCRSLAQLVAPLAGHFAALVSTGGETARALLQAVGAVGLRLVGEIEPGVPLSVTEGWGPIPVITKAGAFGTVETLSHCRAVLHGAAAFPSASEFELS
jgi:D-threonate/D-erythronate kinase